jgi:hypothetical protein
MVLYFYLFIISKIYYFLVHPKMIFKTKIYLVLPPYLLEYSYFWCDYK